MARPSPLAIADRFEFVPLKSGPDVDPDEVELAHVAALEVMVLWGRNVLHVSHLTPPRDFFVGEVRDASAGCDVFVPSEKLGESRLSLVRVEHGAVSVVKPAGARGFIDDARGRRPLEASSAERVELSDKAHVEFELNGFVFHVRSVNAGRPSKRGLVAAWDWNVAAFFGLSFFTSASFLAAIAFFVPNLNGIEDEDSDRDCMYLMQQYLDSAAEREHQRETEAPDSAGKQEGGTGEQAAGESGSMGKPTAQATNKRYAVKGPPENADPQLARERALKEATEIGMIGLLHSMQGDPNAPTAPWGRDQALGKDEASFLGNMWGDDLGEAVGAGGLGLSGSGEGGGGKGRGVGLGQFGGLGHGAGLGDAQGFGNGNGMLGRGHQAKAPGAMRMGAPTVSGRLPPEVIQRVVRQNFGRFRACYSMGLTRNPNLEGRVSARFVIGRDGAVSSVANGGSDLPDSAVVSCVISSVLRAQLPAARERHRRRYVPHDAVTGLS
ncbi:MAG: AgmX/PglI C-terminal domain-containing protein [Polyangiaceae bacterium]